GSPGRPPTPARSRTPPSTRVAPSRSGRTPGPAASPAAPALPSGARRSAAAGSRTSGRNTPRPGRPCQCRRRTPRPSPVPPPPPRRVAPRRYSLPPAGEVVGVAGHAVPVALRPAEVLDEERPVFLLEALQRRRAGPGRRQQFAVAGVVATQTVAHVGPQQLLQVRQQF